MVLKGRDARSGFAGRISDVLRSEDKASLTPLDIYGAIASGYIIGNGVYMLSDLLRGKRGIRAPEKVETDDYAPFTSVIIPIYNEPIEVVKATLASMSKLEYPEYEIIIADDSEEKRDYGPGFRVIRRQNREGFKGGALRNAFKYIDERSELVAIFDADFTVEKDALRRFAQHFKDPNIGAVQGYMKISANEDKNGLTKFISVISGVSNYILYGRYLKRGFVTVQGTNEVYRRKAIEEIGGVAPYTTVNEDLDTSFRLRKANWKIIYDPNIIGIGLAPETYRKFAGQLSRWTSSTIREYRRHIVSFLKSKEIRFREKLDAIMFLSTWTISLVVSPTLILVPFALLSTPLPIEYTLPISAIMTSLPVAIIFSSTDLKYGIKTAMEGLAMYFWFLLPGYFVSFRAAVEGLVSDGSFNVTDKSNSVVAQESSSK